MSDTNLNANVLSTSTINSVDDGVEKTLQAEEDSEENTSLQQSESPQTFDIFNKMSYIFLQELCFILALLFTTYAAFQEKQPKESKISPAKPFFPEGSMVTDWYRGELGAALIKNLQYEVTFVMYYAPWDAECQAVRNEFDTVANFYYEKVHFSAVNCWQPGSDCALKRGSSIYPGLIAHIGDHGMIYNGPRKAPYMIRFLYNLLTPLVRITKKKDLIDLIQTHGAVVYGCINTMAQYSVLYKTSLLTLEEDPMRETVIAVSMTPLVDVETSSPLPYLQLYLWNETLNYPETGNWTSSAIASWIMKKAHKAFSWIAPSGLSTSKTFSAYLQPGPALILFTPRNPLLPYDDYFQMLQAITLQYYNCNGSYINKYFLEALKVQKSVNRPKHVKFQKECFSKRSDININSVHKTITSCTRQTNVFNVCLDNTVLLHDKEKYTHYNIFEKEHDYDNFNLTTENSEENVCHATESKYNSHKSNIDTSILTGENDQYSAKNLVKNSKEETCRILRAAKKVYKTQGPNLDDCEDLLIENKLTGMACSSNISLSLVAVDSLNYYQMANALGVDVLSQYDNTAVVIIDALRESHYILNSSISPNNIKHFILNFTSNNLSRSIVKKSVVKETEKDTIKLKSSTTKTTNTVHLVELNSDTFLPTVMETGKAFVVLYHTSQCAFCGDAIRIMLRLANIFSHLKFLNFVRIDGELNILPWNYNMPYYPTILFFPSRRKSDSRVFPQHISRTLPHLVNFILANLEPHLRLHALWVLCHQTQFSDNTKVCLSNLRRDNISLIGKLLSQWRSLSSQTKRKYHRNVLRQLYHLQSIHLLLGTSHQSAAIGHHFNMLHSSLIVEWNKAR